LKALSYSLLRNYSPRQPGMAYQNRLDRSKVKLWNSAGIDPQWDDWGMELPPLSCHQFNLDTTLHWTFREWLSGYSKNYLSDQYLLYLFTNNWPNL